MPTISRFYGIVIYMNAVKSVQPIGGYRLKIVFRDDYVGEVDLWPLFANPRGPLTTPFADPTFFQKVYVDPESHALAWPNGYDICSDVLRFYCEQGRITSPEEMEAYFTVQEPATVLQDKSQRK